MARPKIENESEKLTVKRHIGFTESENEMLLKVAKAASLSVPSYLRKLVLDNLSELQEVKK